MNIYFPDAGNNRVRRISTANHPPAFAAGHSQYFAVCMNASLISIDTLLTITDADALQTERWSVITAPMHGTVAAVYSATSTGGAITPTGLSYTPATGYTGDDTFKIRVGDCGNATDTTTVYVTVNNCALASSSSPFDKPTMTVYPNPNSGAFTVNVLSDVDEAARLVITNVVGERVKEFTASTNKPVEVRLDVAAGVYFFNVVSACGVWSGKVVVTAQ